MKIRREFCGQIIEIELTSQELCDAYFEQQHLFDLEECAEQFEAFYEDEDWFGKLSADKIAMAEVIEEVADCYRESISNSDIICNAKDYAAGEALHDPYVLQLIEEHKKEESK